MPASPYAARAKTRTDGDARARARSLDEATVRQDGLCSRPIVDSITLVRSCEIIVPSRTREPTHVSAQSHASGAFHGLDDPPGATLCTSVHSDEADSDL